VLENGLVVLLAPEPGSPLVSVGMMYRVGARNETSGGTGLAHYLEHMCFRATRNFPGREPTESITRVGGRWTGYTWIDQTFYQATVPAAGLDRLLDLERDRMTDAVHDPGEFAQERSSVLAELRSYDSPHALLYDEVVATSFQVHPYRNNTIGYLTDVERLTRDAAWRFYHRYYHPNNAVLAVGGGIDPEGVLGKVKERFGALPPAGESTEVRTAEPPQAGERRVTVRKPGPNAEVLLAFRAPALADPDFPVLLLFDALLAGGKGLRLLHEYPAPAETPLVRALVGSGLATRALTAFQASRYPYVYTVRADVADEAGLKPAEDALFLALAGAGRRDFADEELRRARRQVRAGIAADLDTLAGRVHQLAFFEVSGGYHHLLEMEDRLERVGRDDLARFARDRFARSQATVGWFVPTPGVPVFASAQAVPPAPPPSKTGTTLPATLPPRAVTSRFHLANGVRLAVSSLPRSSLVALRGRIEAGSAFDGRTSGLAALASSFLALPPGGEAGAPALAWLLDEDPAAASNLRYVSFAASCLPGELPGLLRSLARRLARTATDPSGDDLAAARRAALERARQAASSLETALLARAREALFPAGSALGSPPWGEPGAIERIRPEDLGAFLRARVTPSRLEVALAGAIDEVEARRVLEATLGGLVSGARPRPPSMFPARGPSVWTELAVVRADKAQNQILVAWPGDRSRPWDTAATRLLLYLLGETHYAGRLGRALVEPGLVYSVQTTLEEVPGAPGFLAVRTAAPRSDTPAVLHRIREVLQEAARGRFTAAELDEAKAYLRGKRLRQRDGALATAQTLLDDLDNAPGPTPEAVTLEQLNDTARRVFASGAPLALVGGPGR
jgi:zinc protease